MALFRRFQAISGNFRQFQVILSDFGEPKPKKKLVLITKKRLGIAHLTLTKKVMSHSRDGPGVTAPLQTNIVPLTRLEIPPLVGISGPQQNI